MALNKALKIAIVESEKTQLEIAALAKINNTRLSQILRYRVSPPSESEKMRISGVLQKPIAELFPESEVTA